MRRVFFFISVLLLVEVFGSAQICSNKSHCDWISGSVQTINSLRPGMTRADLEKLFISDGGLSTRGRGTYVYNSCPYIKVDVEFNIVQPSDNQKPDMRQDQIKSISRPYLAQPTAD